MRAQSSLPTGKSPEFSSYAFAVVRLQPRSWSLSAQPDTPLNLPLPSGHRHTIFSMFLFHDTSLRVHHPSLFVSLFPGRSFVRRTCVSFVVFIPLVFFAIDASLTYISVDLRSARFLPRASKPAASHIGTYIQYALIGPRCRCNWLFSYHFFVG